MDAPEAARAMQTAFFRRIFQNSRGFVCIGAKGHLATAKFKEVFFQYPEELPKALDYIARMEKHSNLYFCAQLLSDRRRVKDNIEVCTIAWADLDSCSPEKLLVAPSIVLQSSPDRYQAFWCFEKEEQPFHAERLSKQIAYYHRNDGADLSGWDLTQYLRIPGTSNFKYQFPYPKVEIIARSNVLYRLDDFKAYPPVPGETFDVSDLDDITLPNKTAIEILEAHRSKLPDVVFEWFIVVPEVTKDDGGWSKTLWALETTLIESGLTPEEAFIVCATAKCNKYARDGRPADLLWKEVQKAWAYIKEKEEAFNIKYAVLDEMISEEEITSVKADRTIVEDYIEWAEGQTDAAPQYHQAGIFTLLSALGCQSLRLATSFGELIPNLWFMVLGDTTLTRKSTAMDMAALILNEINDTCILATDSSVEGLVSALALRDGLPSVFHRDEIAGLFKQINRREHLAGMMELFCRLYDGGRVKRTLRTQTITVNKPIFVFFGGGIRKKVYNELSEEHIESGFLPRFLFVLADTDMNRFQPLGPPTESSISAREALVERLRRFHFAYSQIEQQRIGAFVDNVPVITQAIMSEDAWQRSQALEHALVSDGMQSDNADLAVPMYQRLYVSILKAAVLIAASRPEAISGDGDVTVNLADLLKAIHYGKQWRQWANDILINAGTSVQENKLAAILKTVIGEPGIDKASIMRRHKLMVYDANQLLDTLKERMLVRVVVKGGTAHFFPKDVVKE